MAQSAYDGGAGTVAPDIRIGDDYQRIRRTLGIGGARGAA